MASKITTGLTGLKVLSQPREKLILIYKNIVELLDGVPSNAAYRKYTEEHAKQRVLILEKTTNVEELEMKFNSQLEEVALQAKQEYYLARKMVQWKPWDGKACEAPSGQWTWP